jgi:hypothetical protein
MTVFIIIDNNTLFTKPTCFSYNRNTERLPCQINFGEFYEFLDKKLKIV